MNFFNSFYYYVCTKSLAHTAGHTLFATSFAPMFIAIYSPRRAARRSIGLVIDNPKYTQHIVTITKIATIRVRFMFKVLINKKKDI